MNFARVIYLTDAFLAIMLISLSLPAQHFEQITSLSLVNDGGDSQTCSWADVDNDGDLDLYITNGWNGLAQGNFFYINNGPGAFERKLSGAIVSDQGQSTYGTWGDYNNDGLVDLFVANANGQPNRLYRNNGGGVFTSILGGPVSNDLNNSRSGIWGDYDNDGDLDLFVANSLGENNNLYRNDGNDVFTKVLLGSTGSDGGISIYAMWMDYDQDGDIDLYVINGGSGSGAVNFLYRNTLIENGMVGFTRVTSGTIATDAESSLGANLIDYDNDGLPDIYVTNFFGNNSLYRNTGGGIFSKISGLAIVSDGVNGQSSAWGDYDNDGDIDLFVTNSTTASAFYSNSNGSFDQVFGEPVTNSVPGSRGASWSDYDNDGDLDLFVCNSGFADNALYQNLLGNNNNWLHLDLEGMTSNRLAFGAIVRLKTGSGWQTRFAESLSGYYSQSSPTIEFGLGQQTLVDSLIIEWPGADSEIFTNLAVNNRYRAIQGTGISVTGFDDADAATALERFRLLANYPNPFNPATTIAIELPKSAVATLEIFDSIGRHVETLHATSLHAGTHKFVWNATDDAGNPLVSGIYFYRLRAGSFVQTRIMQLIR